MASGDDGEEEGIGAVEGGDRDALVAAVQPLADAPGVAEQALRDANDGQVTTLFGTDARIPLGESTELRGEMAHSDGTSGALAWLGEIEHRGERLDLLASVLADLPDVTAEPDVLADALPDAAQYERFVAQLAPIREAYARNDAASALRLAMALADEANKYIDERKPWVIAKQEGADAELQSVCTHGVNLFRVLALALAPVLPRVAREATAFLDAPLRSWRDAEAWSASSPRIWPRPRTGAGAPSRSSTSGRRTSTLCGDTIWPPACSCCAGTS